MFRFVFKALEVAVFTAAVTLNCNTVFADSQTNSGPSKVAQSADLVSPIEADTKVPDADLRAVDGAEIKFSELVASKPTVLIFYRGGWCPFCNTQLGQLATIEPDLRALGYQVIAVSPDHPEKLKESVAKHSLSYTLYSDSKMELATAFGLAFKVDDQTVAMYKEKYKIDLEADSGEIHHLLPVPAAFVINSSGIVKYRYWNPDYKVRVDPKELLTAAKSNSDVEQKTQRH